MGTFPLWETSSIYVHCWMNANYTEKTYFKLFTLKQNLTRYYQTLVSSRTSAYPVLLAGCCYPFKKSCVLVFSVEYDGNGY